MGLRSADFENLDGIDQELLGELRSSLGPFGFQWLCACAVYPGLRFPLTVHLGRRLAEAVGRPPPDEEEHMVLCRLPWFRQGWMPEPLRLALLNALSPEHRRTIRQAIEELFYNVIYGKLAEQDAGPTLDFARPPADWRSRFSAFGKTRNASAPEQDAIFIRYIMGNAPSPADLRLDRKLRRLFGARLAGWLDRKMLAFGTAAIATMGLLWIGSETLVKPMLSESERIDVVTPEMVILPGGTFIMGSPEDEVGRREDEGPLRIMTVESFALAKHEVTVGEYAAFVAATGHEGKGCDSGEGPDFLDDADWRSPGFEQLAKHPVVCVSWEDVAAYIDWLNTVADGKNTLFRLPSEIEWEYAARATTDTRYYWGNSEMGCQYANGADEKTAREQTGWSGMPCDDGYYATAPVGSFTPNAFGLFDMSGNVWEWTEDLWNRGDEDLPGDGVTWAIVDFVRVVRGGSWANEMAALRSAFRGSVGREVRINSVGFRLARTLSPSAQ